MRKLFVFLFVVLNTTFMCGQSIPSQTPLLKEASPSVKTVNDSIPKRNKQVTTKASLLDKVLKGDDAEKAKIQDYKIISYSNDTTFVDTTLTIQKEYKYNYLRKDNFGLMPFANLGQTYNSLTYNFQNTVLQPLFGARARHFNYMEIEDISYYRVPTPLTELFYKTAFEQGQLADSFFTVNTSPRFNFSVAYKGLRSLGPYQNSLTSTGNFRFTTNYTTKNSRYKMRAHIVTQDLFNQENGGLTDTSVENFESGDEAFLNRAILETNFENAESILEGKRFYLDHSFLLFKSKKYDTINNKANSFFNHNFNINHTISFEDKFYQFDQSSQSPLFGEAFTNTSLRDRVTLEQLFNKVELKYTNSNLGDLSVSASNTNYNYGYDRVVVLNGNTITNRLKGDLYALGGNYKVQFKGFNINAVAGINIVGDFSGNYIKGEVSYNINKDIFALAAINHSSRAPNFNTLLYQSAYQDFNWQNNFNNIETQQLSLQLKFKNYIDLTADFSTISDYVFFKQALVEEEIETEATQSIRAFQNQGTINYLRIKLENEIGFGKFAINNTVLYQNVKNGDNVLNVPELTTRNTFYFRSHIFKRAMYLQTGVTLNYFTKYFLNAYNPVLAEFYVQNDREFGEFPRLDFFLNAKIRQTRIYLKAEHLNAAFTGFNFYAAPNYPYRDFTIRFGLVWNFFL